MFLKNTLKSILIKILPKKIINKIGLLTEEYKFTYEDIDYCLRTWRENYRVLYFNN